MPRTASVRGEVVRLLRVAPFRPFVMNLENGDRVTLDHPENIAFDPDEDSPDFYVINGRVRLSGTFDAVSNVGTVESVENLA